MSRLGHLPRPRRLVVAGLTAGVVGAAGLASTAAAPASALPDPCVTAFPADSLVADQDLTGLTVTRGTEPEAFSGTYLDTLEDGIAPGVDLIIARLSSPTIEKAGIWQGMSGSPVYDPATGELVGAVSYALSMGPTTIAGLTPAADMLDLVPAATPTLAEKVSVPRSLARSLVGSGDATAAQAAAGMQRLPLPIAVSGLSADRFTQLADWLDDNGPVTRASGSADAAAVPTPMVAGGNLAASLSDGTVTMAAVGTATYVCGDDVLGFGHPLAFAGDSTYTLRGADAITIQPDVAISSFKLANLGAPVGTVVEDRMTGIRGVLGALPTTYDVTSSATYRGRDKSGVTHVSVPALLTDLSLSNMIAISDRALDHVGKGGADASWTIQGTRRNGTPFTLHYSNVYADDGDVSVAPVYDLATQLYALTENETEKVTITSVTTHAAFDDDASQWKIGRTYYRANGAWRRITSSRPAVLRAGTTRTIRVELYSRDLDTQYRYVTVTTPKRAAKRPAALTIAGGAPGGDEYFFDYGEEYYDEGGSSPETIPEVLKSYATAQKNDEMKATLQVRGLGTLRTRTYDLGKVVSGTVVVPIALR